MSETTPISKIKLIDGTVVNLANVVQLEIPELCSAYVTWNISGFSGSVSQITGTTDDYLLTINEQRS